MERFDKMPSFLKEAVEEFMRGNLWDREYIDGFLEGTVMMYGAIQSFETALSAEALRRTEKWFEDEVVAKHTVDEVYTPDLEEVHGYVFLSNVRGEWANEFFDRLELERKSLRDVYCKEGGFKGANTEKSK